MHVIFWDILSSVLRVRFQAHHLKSETELYEEKEQQLVNDCVKELSKSEGCDRCRFDCFLLRSGGGWNKLPPARVLSGLSSLQISTIAEELARKTEDASRQQEEITHLLSQIVDLQKKAKSVRKHALGKNWEVRSFEFWQTIYTLYMFVQYAVENEELSQHLLAAKDAQRQLTAEVVAHVTSTANRSHLF